MTMQGAKRQKPLRDAKPEIFVSPTKGAMFDQAARQIVELLKRAAQKSSSPITVSLSGGSTPRDLHLLLTDQAQPYYSQIPWERIHFFWGDERFVPATDKDSNFRMAKETLLDRIPGGENYHRIITENRTPEESAQAYQRELQMFFHLKDISVPPVFDLVLLGLGSNAHTASLFPDTPLDELQTPLYEDCWVKSFYVPELNAMRVSLTPKIINAATAVLFLVSGKDKAEALWRVIESDDPPEKCPAKLIHPLTGRLIWDVDAEAADLLTKRP